MPLLKSAERKVRRAPGRRRSLKCLVYPVLTLAVYLLYMRRKAPTIHDTQPPPATINAANLLLDALWLEFEYAPFIPNQSLTAILPVTSDSLPNLAGTLSPFMASPNPYLHEILVLSSANIVAQTRDSLKAIVSNADSSTKHPDLSLRLWEGNVEQQQAISVIGSAAHLTTDWVLVLDTTGLQNTQEQIRNTVLLQPKVISRPIGPIGYILSALDSNATWVKPSDRLEAASFLQPPFVMPVSFARQVVLGSDARVWTDLGKQVAESHLDQLGGVVVGLKPQSKLPENSVIADGPLVREQQDRLVILFPSLTDLQLFSPVACSHKDKNPPLLVLYGSKFAEGYHTIESGCTLDYFTTDDTADIIQRVGCPSVLITLAAQNTITAVLSVRLEKSCASSTRIHIPRIDLPHTAWISSLSLQELTNWNLPQIHISVITQNRPRSLSRLLDSLSNGMFFGDNCSLQIHLEQSSDSETLKRVQDFKWVHGPIALHHRVVQGGLLPAVVESWYPHSNDSYGLLLEDDIEVSKWFYAWLKMSVLKYRYGEEKNKSPQLFGISLYQQKNLELKPTGRVPFDARALFAQPDNARTIPDASTPYLSAIPCSWGAVYFPEHWREFHEYLSVRLSEYIMSISTIVVPDVRSNRWSKSWKRYFIELVYLRGYVMLYPNYDNFASLSTNHLEVGSHVQVGDRSNEKRQQFVVPLMQVPQETDGLTSPIRECLLELPSGKLPEWDDLPVLNLTGSIDSIDGLMEIGRQRRDFLTQCAHPPFERYDVRNMWCISVLQDVAVG